MPRPERLELPIVAACVLALGLTAIATDGNARPDAAAEPTERLEEVLVTARRREERLHGVPIAMSVFQQSELEQRQVDDLAGLQFVAPNLVIATDQTNRATSFFAMRGQVEPGSVPTLDPTVGLYLDGVYIARITGANLRMIDMDRVEVLRGPQGTLFGRNTIGGALNLVTQRPSADFEGHAEAVIGNYDLREIQGVANLPFSEGSHAVRVVAAHMEHSGYGRSTLLGRDLDDDDTDFARAQLRLAPAPHWDLVLSADYTRFRNGGQLWTLLDTSPSSARVTAASGNPGDDIRNYVNPFHRAVPANRAGTVNSRTSGVAATLAFDGPRWTFKSITAGRQLESRARDVDQDATPYDLAVVLRRDDEQDQFSQEFQIYGNALEGRLEWIGGLHYFEERASFDQQFLAFEPVTSSFNENLPAGDARNDSKAAYAQVVYAISPRLRFTGGLRANEDGRQLTSRNARRISGVESCTVDPTLRDSPGLCRATLPRREFHYLPFVVGIDFQPFRRALLYAKMSRGHRAGGYNLRGATAANLGTFDPESVLGYEVGAKADLFDDRLRVALALFQSRFEDIQLVQLEVVGGQPNLFVQNGGEARINGGELEFTALLGRLRLNGSLGIVDARFTKLEPNVVDASLDSEFRFTPDATVALSANWAIPAHFGGVDLHLDYSWRDDVPFEYDRNSIARQEAFGLWNASVDFDIARSGLDVRLWARNLTNERYFSRALNSITFVGATLGDPRIYGMSVRYRFGRGPLDSAAN